MVTLLHKPLTTHPVSEGLLPRYKACRVLERLFNWPGRAWAGGPAIELVSWLLLRSNVSRLERVSSAGGMLPSRVLVARFKVCRVESLPRPGGMLPSKVLLERFNVCSWVKVPRALGIMPVRV